MSDEMSTIDVYKVMSVIGRPTTEITAHETKAADRCLKEIIENIPTHDNEEVTECFLKKNKDQGPAWAQIS